MVNLKDLITIGKIRAAKEVNPLLNIS